MLNIQFNLTKMMIFITYFDLLSRPHMTRENVYDCIRKEYPFFKRII